MRRSSPFALLAAITFLVTTIGVAIAERADRLGSLERRLATEANEQAGLIRGELQRARGIARLTAHNPAFRGYYRQLGRRDPTARTRGDLVDVQIVRDVQDSLGYLARVFPTSIGEACFVDRTGLELARAVHGKPLADAELAPDKSDRPFFAPAFAATRGNVFQARPFVSKDTNDWVLPTATEIATDDGRERAILHFDLKIESIRAVMASHADDVRVAVIDGDSGAVLIDSAHPQAKGGELGLPHDRSFAALAHVQAESGLRRIGDRDTAFARVDRRSKQSDNQWYVAVAPTSAATGTLAGFGKAPLAFIAVALAGLGFVLLRIRSRQSELQSAATTDSLTGLGSRRKLMHDLGRTAASVGDGETAVLVLFDLDGFKGYNDAFGHPAGDALLARLGHKLAETLPGGAHAYRPGGDEFCVLARVAPAAVMSLVEDAAAALSEKGDGFDVRCSYGVAMLPDDVTSETAALQLADQRMYAQKARRRSSAAAQTRDVLMRALHESQPDLSDHVSDVASLAVQVAAGLGLEEQDIVEVRHVAELHDIGKVAIPDSILQKPGPLDEDEWRYMRRHTVIGERILAAAPALSSVAPLVRATHERWDGGGYPDGIAGEEIPRAARIVFACDAFHAMTSFRPYTDPRTVDDAIVELRACAGSQFDPAVVEVLCEVLGRTVAAPRGSA